MTHQHQQHATTTTTVQMQISGRTILDNLMHKLPSTRKYYRVNLFVPDNGIPIIEYQQTSSKKPKKSIQFADLLFADKRHDTNEKFAFSIYTVDKTITFLAQDETNMNEWLSKVREFHSNLYPEFKRYDAIFEANLLDKGLAKTMHIQGQYRLALCKESLDLIPLLTIPQTANQLTTAFTYVNSKAANQTPTIKESSASSTASSLSNTLTSANTNSTFDDIKTHHHHSIIHPLTTNANITPHANHNNLPHHLPNHQRFHKRHPLISSKTIELLLRSIRRCGHKDCNFYIESGRHSQIGEGDLWMALNKKSTARALHELLLATMKLASANEDQFLYKTPRSRSGSSSENAHRSQQSRSSSLICLASGDPASSANNNSSAAASPTTINNNYLGNQAAQQQASVAYSPIAPQPTQSATIANSLASITSPIMSTLPMLSSGNSNNTNNNNDEDSGYLPMA